MTKRVVDQVKFRGTTLTDGEKDLKVDYGKSILGSVIQAGAGLTVMYFILTTFPDRDPRIPVNIVDPKIMHEYIPQLLIAGAFIFVMNLGERIVKSSFRAVKVGVESDNLTPFERLKKFSLRSLSNAVIGISILNLCTAYIDKFSPEVHNALDEIKLYASFHQHFYDILINLSNGFAVRKFIAYEAVLLGVALFISKKADEISSDN